MSTITGVEWVDLCEDDVLVGRLDPSRRSRLGSDPDEPGLQADLSVAADVTGKIVLRVPDAVAPTPEEMGELVDLDEVWEPQFNAAHEVVGGRGLLHYATRAMPDGVTCLEIVAEEEPFGSYA